jgi:hypothetical protein
MNHIYEALKRRDNEALGVTISKVDPISATDANTIINIYFWGLCIIVAIGVMLAVDYF